jgi:peptidoglycan hydrolase-like protein with peptidoglycan-binding domain
MRGRLWRIAAASLALATANIAAAAGMADPAQAASLAICNDTTGLDLDGTATWGADLPSLGHNTYNWQCEHRLGAGYNFATGQGTKRGIASLQDTINHCYPGAPNVPLATDGRYGERTTAAVRWVQGRVGVSVDGKAGPVTRRHMKWAFHDIATGQGGVTCQNWT